MFYFIQGGVTRSKRFDTEPTVADLDEFRQKVRLVTLRIKQVEEGVTTLVRIDTLNS